MKNFLNCFLLSGVFLLISCKKDSNDTNRSSFEGTWRIVLFTDHGNDETNDFSGYLFSFGNNGVLEASKSGSAKTGTWSYEGDEFNINLGEKTGSNKPLGELTDDWELISKTSTEIKLKDDNDASAEFLTFKKN